MEILRPLASILAVLTIIFSGYCAARYLADETYGLMPAASVILLIALKVLISFEVLLPATLYLSVIIALGRLYRDEEMTALFASGVGMGRVLAIVVAVSIVIAVLAAGLSLYVRPWAYSHTFWLKAKAEAEFDVTRLREGRFYRLGGGDKVIFVEKIDHGRRKAHGVFVRSDDGQVLKVVYADEARQYAEKGTGQQVILFLDGHMYEFPRSGKEGKATSFRKFSLSLLPKEITPPEYKIKAAPTEELFMQRSAPHMAELQWRLSAPLTTLLLALLGALLARTTPRQGKYAKVTVGALIYALYHGLGILAKILLEQGVVPSMPGIWWTQASLAGLIMWLMIRPSARWYTFRRLQRRLLAPKAH